MLFYFFSGDAGLTLPTLEPTVEELTFFGFFLKAILFYAFYFKAEHTGMCLKDASLEKVRPQLLQYTFFIYSAILKHLSSSLTFTL